MEEIIIEFLKKNDYTREKLYELINGVADINIDELDSYLTTLVEERKIFKNTKNKYSIMKNYYVVAPLQSKSKGEKFIVHNGDKIIIPPNELHNALKDDLVIVDISKLDKGSVMGIVQRKNKKLVCEVKLHKNKMVLVPFNGNCEVSLLIKKDKEKELFKDLIIGDRVYVTLNNDVDDDNCILVDNITKIGHFNDKMNDEIAIAISKNFDIDFSDEAIKEAEEIPTEVREIDKRNRIDLTDDNIFTIDSITTKDMDDAISIKKLYNGNYQLSVHIADVGYYVKPGSALFKDALRRGTSVYLGEVVIPMIPSVLSNGICSLNEGVERLTKTVTMEIDSKGKIVNYKIFDSVIKSKKKMTYEDLNNLFKGETVDDGSYIKFMDDLILMRELSKILQKRKEHRGNLEFESKDMKIHCDLDDNPNEFEKRENQEAEKLIENFMIAANETVAENFYWMNLPFIYRVHNRPDEIKIDQSLELIKSLGYKIKQLSESYDQKTLQKILNSFKGTTEYTIISNLLLRNMAKAKYSTANMGHYALVSNNYCHFTSPIRRFPDLAIHTLINKYLNNNKGFYLNKFVNELDDIANHSSYKERQADDAERDYIKLKMAQYMEKHINEEFEGYILDIDKNNVYIMLDNNIKGILDLNGDFYKSFEIDNFNRVMNCTYSNKQVKIGTRVKIKVTEVDIPQKQIYFDIKEILKSKNGPKKLELKKD